MTNITMQEWITLRAALRAQCVIGRRPDGVGHIVVREELTVGEFHRCADSAMCETRPLWTDAKLTDIEPSMPSCFVCLSNAKWVTS